MIGCGLSLLARAVNGGGGGAAAPVISYIGASAPSTGSATVTCTLPQTAQAGDIIFLVAQAATAFVSSTLPNKVNVADELIRYKIAVGGETTAAITLSGNVSAVAALFRVSGGTFVAGANGSLAGAPPAAQTLAYTAPSLTLIGARHAAALPTPWTTLALPAGAVTILAQPYSASTARAIFAAYVIHTTGTGTGNIRIASGANTVTTTVGAFGATA